MENEIKVPDYSTPFIMEQLNETHRYHAPKNNQLPRYDEIRRETLRLSLTIERCCPPSAEKVEAQKLLTLAKMMANASIAINEARVAQAPSESQPNCPAPQEAPSIG